MTFTDNNSWFTVLIIVHVFGAIAGIGPTYAYSVLGAVASKSSPEGALALIRGMVKIEKAPSRPVFFIVQPVTGALLIFNRSSIRANFWKEEWLVISIVLYIVLWALILPETRNMETQVNMGDAGQGGTPEFQARVERSMKIGPVLGILGTVLILLMIWKPGSDCAVQGLLRC